MDYICLGTASHHIDDNKFFQSSSPTKSNNLSSQSSTMKYQQQGFTSISFTNFQTQETRPVTQKAANWHIITHGANLEGRCPNPNCEAGRPGQRIWIMKGYGYFNLNEELLNSQCPICHWTADSITTIGYYKTELTIMGRKQSNTKGQLFQQVYKADQNDKMKTFAADQIQKENWMFLKAIAVPLSINKPP